MSGSEGESEGERESESESYLLRSSLELRDATIYEPQMRALLGTASHFCEAVVLKLRAVPLGTVLNSGVFRVIRRGAQAMHERAGEPNHCSPPGALCSDLALYCPLCGKVSEVTLGSDFTHTLVGLSIFSCQWQFGNLLSKIM